MCWTGLVGLGCVGWAGYVGWVRHAMVGTIGSVESVARVAALIDVADMYYQLPAEPVKGSRTIQLAVASSYFVAEESVM